MQYTMNHARAIAQRVMVVSMLGLCLSSTGVYAQRLTWLGTLGGVASEANGVSADGSVVVGSSTGINHGWHAFRWTVSGGMQDLGVLPGGIVSYASDVSADGSVVVGYSTVTTDHYYYDYAFRWTELGGMENLGTLGGAGSQAYGVSDDGWVVVGNSLNTGNVWRAFRWMVGGFMHDLGTLGGDRSSALGVSADGSVVVGMARNASGQVRACRWTASSGSRQDLGTLPGYDASQAHRVSADGSVVVGGAYNATGGIRAFRWENGVMHDLGTLGGDRSYAYDVSADGSVVVGASTRDGWDHYAFRWTEADGMEDLNITFAPLLTDGSGLIEARAISPDGRYIVGYGHNAATGQSEGFLLDTMVTITGNVELRDFTGDVTQIPVTVELRQGGNVVGTRTLNLDPSSNYTFAAYLGTYDLAFKASHWLRTVVPNVSVSGSSVTVNVSLTNGDIDGDNEVTLFDFGALVSAFGSMPGDSNWNPEADLDGDNEVTLFDFGVLVSNFGAIGDD